MSVSSGEKRSSEHSAEIGPPPYYHRSDCNICRKQDGLKTESELLDAPRPGGYIVEGEHFLAEHAPLQESSAGTVIVEARRHLLDFGEMTPAELAELGSILNRLVPAIKAATGVQRVYFGSPYLTGVPSIRPLRAVRLEPACRPLRGPGRHPARGHLP